MGPYKLVRRVSPDDHKIIDIPGGPEEVRIGRGYCTIVAHWGPPGDTDHWEEWYADLQAMKVRIIGVEPLEHHPESAADEAVIAYELPFLDRIRTCGFLVMAAIMDFSQLALVDPHTDIIRVRSQDMQNYALLEALGGISKPVVLERGYASSIEEWLMAAEYIVYGGNPRVILCESGIRTFERLTPWTLDINGLVLARQLSNLPIIAYPGRAAGKPEMVLPLGKAALAAGADGLIINIGQGWAGSADDSEYSPGPAGLAGIIHGLQATIDIEKRIRR